MARIAVGAAAVLAVGCGGPAEDTVPAVVRRDSVGITIIENSRDIRRLPVWHLDTAPLVRIGGDTILFYGVNGARQLADGSIAVTNVRTDVKLFDSTGSFLKMLARKGRGPGEFNSPGPPMRLSGDTTYVMDEGSANSVMFTGATSVLVPPQPLPPGRDAAYLPIALVTTDTLLLIAFQFGRPTPPGIGYHQPFPFVRAAANGSIVDTVAFGKGTEAYPIDAVERGQAVRSSQVVAMGRHTAYAVGAGVLLIGEPTQAGFQSIDLRRRTTRIVRWKAPADRVTSRDKQDYVRFESAALATQRWSEESRAEALDNLRSQIFAKEGPHYTGFLLTDDGGVWLEQFSRPWRLARHYLVFDSTGALVARAELPPRVRPFQVTGDRMVARWRDHNDVDYVRVYRIRTR